MNNEILRLNKAVSKSINDLNLIIKRIKDYKNDIYEEMKFMLEANISIIKSSSLVKDAKKELNQI